MMDTYRVAAVSATSGRARPAAGGDRRRRQGLSAHPGQPGARGAADLPELRASRLGSKRAGGAGDLDLLFDLVSRLDGCPGASRCTRAVLLSDATLLDRTPVENSYLGYPMSQFDKDDVEELGLLKLDLLGIRMQSAIAHASTRWPASTARPSTSTIPRDDEPTFSFDPQHPHARHAVADRVAGAKRAGLDKFSPQTFEDLIIDICAVPARPGEERHGHPVPARRNGWRDAVYPHPT